MTWADILCVEALEAFVQAVLIGIVELVVIEVVRELMRMVAHGQA